MCGRFSVSSFFPFRIDRIPAVVFTGLILVCPLVAEHVRAQALINEIYYDHPGSDEGFEFIELINVSTSAVSLHEYAVEFHNGAEQGWTLVWSGSAGDSIAVSSLFLIGGSSVDPHPDAAVQLNLQNGPDAVRLLRGGVQVDLCGYGALDDARYFESSSAPDVPAGKSLGRMPDARDTNDNFADFRELVPSPGRFNLPRTDLSIHPDPEFERAVDAEAAAAISFYVQNDGTMGVASNEFTVEVRDSSAYAEDLAAMISGAAVAPGERVRMECAALLQRGYHWITAFIRHPGDERPHNDTLAAVVRAGNPGIVISEVMSYPRGECPQYVEVYNAAAEPADIGGWSIRDCARGPQTISIATHILPPREYAILTRDAPGLAAAFAGLDPRCVVEMPDSWPLFNHAGSEAFADSIVMADRFGLPVDRVAYPPQESNTKGISIERADLYPGERMHAWLFSTSPEGGTPGRENSVFAAKPPSGPGMALSPNPFEIGTEVLLIEIPYRPHVERVVVAVYDIHGAKVHEPGAACGLPAVFVWDGKRSDGTDVESGIYVVACEEFFAGNERRVERVVVGCGKRGSKKK